MEGYPPSMTEPIVFVDSSEILEGKLEDVKTVVKELVEFVDANEPRPIAYHVYFSADGTLMTVIQVHPDSASMEFHMEAAGSVFPQFKDLLKMSTMDIYGKPSDRLLKQMRDKAKMLGAAGVVVHELQAGLSRFRVP
jgi:quinol monooxygenase YgiN